MYGTKHAQLELSTMNGKFHDEDDYKSSDVTGPLLGNNSSGSDSNSNGGSKPPNMLRVQCCAVTSVAGFIVLSIIATYILADSEGRYLILDKEDTKEARTSKAVHVFLAAALYLVIGVYNCYIWKKTDNNYSGDSGYQALD